MGSRIFGLNTTVNFHDISHYGSQRFYVDEQVGHDIFAVGY